MGALTAKYAQDASYVACTSPSEPLAGRQAFCPAKHGRMAQHDPIIALLALPGEPLIALDAIVNSTQPCPTQNVFEQIGQIIAQFLLQLLCMEMTPTCQRVLSSCQISISVHTMHRNSTSSETDLGI